MEQILKQMPSLNLIFGLAWMKNKKTGFILLLPVEALLFKLKLHTPGA